MSMQIATSARPPHALAAKLSRSPASRLPSNAEGTFTHRISPFIAAIRLRPLAVELSALGPFTRPAKAQLPALA